MALVVTAIHTFVAEHSDELEFQAGEKITVLEKDDAFGDGWWKGRNEKGDEGLFPATYISEEDDLVTPATAATPSAATVAGPPATAPATDAVEPESRSGDPIPVPPSPKAGDVAQPASPDPAAHSNGLASPFVPPVNGSPKRNSLLDITGQPMSAPSVATAGQGGNVMGSTIGEVQEAIDTMGQPSPNVPKGVQLRDPQEALHDDVARESDKEEDEDPTAPIGIAQDARARLAEQAKLANEERDRQAHRDSGGIADLIYSDESDDEEDSPSFNRSLQNMSLNGTAANGSALGASGITAPSQVTASPQRSEPAQELAGDHTPIASPTGPVGLQTSQSNQETPRAPGPSTSPRVVSAPIEPVPQPTEQISDNKTMSAPGLGLAAAATGAAAGAAGAGAWSHSRNVSGSTPATSAPTAGHSRNVSGMSGMSADVPVVGGRSSSITSSPAMGGQSRLSGQSAPPAQVEASPRAATTFPLSSDTASHHTPAKPPSTWTVDEVVEWSRSKGFDETICGKFVEHDISGDVLLELDAAMLKELDIPQFGKRVRIAAAINELRRPNSAMSGSSPHPTGVSGGSGGSDGTRTYSAPPSAYAVPSPHSATSPVNAADDHHNSGAWGHGRKVSMTPSTPAIDEVPGARPTVNPNANGNAGPRNSGVSPASATTSTSGGATIVSPTAAAAAASAATMASLSKRESSSSLGHKRNKGSIDKNDRLSFFGRGRKQAPPLPANSNQSSSRLAFNHGKQTTTMTAAAPERRTSSSNTTAATVGSAMRTIGTPDKTGYLKKRGERYNTWKTRFFVLKGSYLYFLKSESEDRVKGHIDLKGHRIIVDGNTNPGHYGFQLVGPGNEKAHFFSSSEQGEIRDWMKAIMKATIARDYTVPVTSSCNIPTIPLAEAQALQPRPPSPSQIDATQRANRRENVNQLTPRDASVLMSLDTTSSGRRMTSHGSSLNQTPSRPSRDTRRASTSKGSVGRPSIASYYPPEDEHHAELMQWVNTVLPQQYPRAAYFPNSFISGEVIFLIVKHLSGVEPNPPLSATAFNRDPNGQPNVEGLFAMMDCVIDAGIDSAGVSLNEIRAGDAAAVATLLDSVRAWAHAKGVA